MTSTLNDFRDELNAVSPTFCIAKWKQLTLHLQTGHTHSCHHPPTHVIPLEEIAANPSALHNTYRKKKIRQLMLKGMRPAECDYCWRVEDTGADVLSDRVYKSSDIWAKKYLSEVSQQPWDFDVVPSYLEVSFSSVCNFKCSYCTPEVSTQWMEEIKQHGAYPTSTKFNNLEWLEQQNKMPIPHNAYNPYVEAFWKWWPTIYDKLDHFRITGGEPLLAKDTFKVLDWLLEHPNENLDFSINSNMCIPDSILDKFIEKIKRLCAEKKVRKFKIFTSADGHGVAAEYIRSGLNYNQWLKNIRRVLDAVPECTFTIMSTYNALSIGSYKKFMEDVVAIKQQYGTSRNSPLILDTPYLRYPPHQAIFILPNSWAEKIKEQLDYVKLHTAEFIDNPNIGFHDWEYDKFERLYELMQTKQDMQDKITQQHKDFVAFVDEHDKRRGTNFLATFPEYTELYYFWKNNEINSND